MRVVLHVLKVYLCIAFNLDASVGEGLAAAGTAGSSTKGPALLVMVGDIFAPA